MTRAVPRLKAGMRRPPAGWCSQHDAMRCPAGRAVAGNGPYWAAVDSVSCFTLRPEATSYSALLLPFACVRLAPLCPRD
jgi:hypothetical protein